MKGFALDLMVSEDLAAIRAEVVRKKRGGAASPGTQARHPCSIPASCSLWDLSFTVTGRAGGSKSLRNGATNAPRTSEMDYKVLA